MVLADGDAVPSRSRAAAMFPAGSLRSESAQSRSRSPSPAETDVLEGNLGEVGCEICGVCVVFRLAKHNAFIL